MFNGFNLLSKTEPELNWVAECGKIDYKDGAARDREVIQNTIQGQLSPTVEWNSLLCLLLFLALSVTCSVFLPLSRFPYFELWLLLMLLCRTTRWLYCLAIEATVWHFHFASWPLAAMVGRPHWQFVSVVSRSPDIHQAKFKSPFYEWQNCCWLSCSSCCCYYYFTVFLSFPSPQNPTRQRKENFENAWLAAARQGHGQSTWSKSRHWWRRTFQPPPNATATQVRRPGHITMQALPGRLATFSTIQQFPHFI